MANAGYMWFDPAELQLSPGDYETHKEAAEMASFCLWALSGRKFNGLQTVTETYRCNCASYASLSVLPGQLALFSYEPYLSMLPSEVSDGCGCSEAPHSRLRLRRTPVQAVHAVSRGGTLLDPATYRVTDKQVLESVSGTPLHACNLEVTYVCGARPPHAGSVAAKRLAHQFLLSWSDDEEDADNCALPRRVTSVSRQGVSYTILDDQAFLDDLRTGVYEVDLFLKAVNPDKARRRARVMSPDTPRGRRRTS